MKVTLTGPNNFLLLRELGKIKADFVKANGDLALETLDGQEESVEKIKQALESMPFLSSHKMVVVRSLSSNKEASERAEELIKLADENTDLVIVEPKPDKRTAYFKFLKKATELQEYRELDEQGLTHWLISEAKNRDAELKSTDAAYLVSRIGLNQEMAENELSKLINYDKNITRENIDLLCEPTPSSSIFDLLNAAFSGQTKKTLEIYKDQRAQGVEPQAILAMIVWQAHLIALTKAAGDKSTDSISADTGTSPFVIRKSKTIASNLASSQVGDLLDNLRKLDKDLKSKPIDADEALTNLLIKISQ